jgi:hypothetical protein
VVLRYSEGAMKIGKCRFRGGSDLLRSLSQDLKMSALLKRHLCSSTCHMSETTQRIKTKLSTGSVCEPSQCVGVPYFI